MTSLSSSNANSNNNNNNSSSATNNTQGTQIYRLKVEDALSYLDKVKFQFDRQPAVYNQFLDIMKEFKSQAIDTPGVISRVSNLFRGHNDLIEGFNTFLPPGYKIEVNENDSVQFTAPNSTSSTIVHPIGSIPPAISSTPPANGNRNVPLNDQIKMEQNASQLTNRSILGLNNTPPPQSQSQQTAQQNPQNQVEFGHAINYVNKIKSRFHNQPDVYKSFLEILHTYQKQQKNMKEGIPPNQSYLSETEVYAKVAKLFKNQEDLLIEFSQFLPDANNTLQTQQSIQQQVNEFQNSYLASNTQNLSQLPLIQQTMMNIPLNATLMTHASSALSNKIPSNMGKQQQQQFGNNLSNKNMTSSSMKNISSQNQPLNVSKMSNNIVQQQTSPSLKRTAPAQQLPLKKQKTNISNMSGIQNQSMTTTKPSNTLNRLSANNPNIMNNFNVNNNSHMNVNLIRDKFNTLNEITFFERVKKALRTQQVYDNFLKCLALFNQDIISRNELITLVEPFLGKFANLYRWFKDYVDNKPTSNANFENEGTERRSTTRDRLNVPNGDHIPMEIDYLSCKQYGASYRDISAYPQPISTGQTDLCKQVLNSTYVSFPSWSEDSTFISSKKNQYEELIFRIEDERFELDVVLESNLSTIRALEKVMNEMSQMSNEELNKFRLTNALGGNSESIHVKAIQRVYCEKSKDIIDGLKRNPPVAVPLVLKRLKAKDEEWREAKKNFEKTWREQIEKNYLKSLDYCAAPFKQNDQKHLKTKSLLNEIETIYFERQELKEETSSSSSPSQTNSQQPIIQHNQPHLSFKYDDKSILEDAAALIIHHVKRQTAIQKEDKHKIKQVVYHFLPDLFFISRGALSDDESTIDNASVASHQSNSHTEINENKKLRSAQNLTPTRHTDANKRRLTDIDFEKTIPNEYKTPDDLYRLFYVDEHWYLFLRYHQILCERLYKIYKQSLQIAEQEVIDSRNREDSVAEALKLRNKCEIAVDEYYPAFLDIVRNLLDGNMDSTQYEDTLREMFGIHAYITFTLDKVVHHCVRQLQYLVQDETSINVKQLYLDECRHLSTSHSGCGGKVSNMSHSNVMNAELAFQKKAELLLSDQNCYKIISYKNSFRLTVELIDTQSEDEDDEEVEVEKWSDYVHKYSSEHSLTELMKENLLKNPVFLTKSAHVLKNKIARIEKKKQLTASAIKTATATTAVEETAAIDNKTEISEKMETDPVDETNKVKENDASTKKKTSKKIVQVENMFMYRRNALKNARKSHHSISKRMFDRFRKCTNKWLKDNSIPTDCIDDWLLGEHLDPEIKTICIKESSLKKTPYHIFYRYKVLSNESNQANSNLASTSTTSKTTNDNMNINNIDTESSHEKDQFLSINEQHNGKNEPESTKAKDTDTSVIPDKSQNSTHNISN